jgi:trigger factor
VVAGAEVDVPEPLVEARAHELLDRMLHALGHQGITKDHYLKISGKTEDELIGESKPDAEQALRREAVLAAIIEAEQIEPTEQQLLDALEPAAEREQMSRQKLLDRLRHAGRDGDLVQEVAAEQAIDLVITEAKPISVEEAEKQRAAAEKQPAAAPKKKAPAKRKPAAKKAEPADELWTPDSETAEGKTDKLWTPGS